VLSPILLRLPWWWLERETALPAFDQPYTMVANHGILSFPDMRFSSFSLRI